MRQLLLWYWESFQPNNLCLFYPRLISFLLEKKLFRKGQHLYHLFVRATFHQILSTPNNPKPNLPSSWQLLRHQVSPLLSYEGEGLGARPVPGAVWGWLESFVFFVPFSRCGRCGSFGAKEKEYAVSFRQNPGLGIAFRSICLCGNQGEPCILFQWMDADSFTSTKNTKTLPRVVSTWISQVLLHTSIVIHKLGWAMHHWLKTTQWHKKQKPTHWKWPQHPGLYFDMLSLRIPLGKWSNLTCFQSGGSPTKLFCTGRLVEFNKRWLLQEANAWTLMVPFWCLGGKSWRKWGKWGEVEVAWVSKKTDT